MKIAISQIKLDDRIMVRKPHEYTISNYSEAMRVGDKFPPLVIDQKDRLVCGFNRYWAYMRVYGRKFEINVNQKQFANDAEAIMYAASDNARHGRPLDVADKTAVTQKLIDMKVSPEDVAHIFGVRPDKIKRWAGMYVEVVGESGKKTHEPLKPNANYMIGKTVTKEAHREHAEHDSGNSVLFHVNQVIMRINRGWVDRENERLIERLEELRTVLDKFLN